MLITGSLVALQEHAGDDLQVDGLSDTDCDDDALLDNDNLEETPALDTAQIAKRIKGLLQQKTHSSSDLQVDNEELSSVARCDSVDSFKSGKLSVKSASQTSISGTLLDKIIRIPFFSLFMLLRFIIIS